MCDCWTSGRSVRLSENAIDVSCDIMEKFAIDLDKVLDDFEFNEGTYLRVQARRFLALDGVPINAIPR